MRPRGADRAVADVVALDAGAQEEGALDVALAGRLGLVQDPDDVLEAARGGVARLLELADLELVLHGTRLGEVDAQFLVALRGDLVGQRRLDTGVVATHDADRAARLAQLLRQLAHVLGRDAQQLLCLGQGVTAADPQLTLARQPELAVLTVGARQQVDGGLVRAVLGLQNEDAVLGQVAGEVGVLGGGAEGVLGVIGTGLQIARRDHQALAGKTCRQRGTAGGGLRGLRDGLQVAQLGVGPARRHVLGELVGHARVQAVLTLLDRLLFFFRGLRGSSSATSASWACRPFLIRHWTSPGFGRGRPHHRMCERKTARCPVENA